MEHEMKESTVLAECMRVLAGRSDLRAWRQSTGVARALANEQVISYGLPGCADISGIYKDGRRLEIEVKTFRVGSKLSPQQRAFRAMIESYGGIYIVARSADELRDALDLLSTP